MLLTTEKAAQLLGITPRTAQDWARRGVIPRFKVRGRWRFRAEDLEQWCKDASARSDVIFEPVRDPQKWRSTDVPRARSIGVDSKSLAEILGDRLARGINGKRRSTKAA